MSNEKTFTLTRAQIAKFVTEQRAIIAIERAIRQANEDIPINLDELVSLAETASGRAESAIDIATYLTSEINNYLSLIEPSIRGQIVELITKTDENSTNIEAIEAKAQAASEAAAIALSDQQGANAIAQSAYELANMAIANQSDIDAKAQEALTLAADADRRSKFNGVLTWLSIP